MGKSRTQIMKVSDARVRCKQVLVHSDIEKRLGCIAIKKNQLCKLRSVPPL